MDKEISYTKRGLVIGIISLIPVFPFYSLELIAWYQFIVESLGFDCKHSHDFLFVINAFLMLLILFFYPNHVKKGTLKSNSGQFLLVCILLYIISNTLFLQIKLGYIFLCSTDGQIIMELIYSAPVASFSIFMFGLYVDHNREIASKKENQ